MKRRAITLIVIVLVAGLVYAGYAYMSSAMSANSQNATAKTIAKDDDSEPHNRSAPVKEPGKYADYEESLVESSNGQTLLFFHAPWCPQCRMIDEDIKQNGLPDGVTVLKVDYDSNNELKKKYSVTLQTTFIKVNQSGDEIAKYVAYNEPVFESVASALLK